MRVSWGTMGIIWVIIGSGFGGLGALGVLGSRLNRVLFPSCAANLPAWLVSFATDV